MPYIGTLTQGGNNSTKLQLICCGSKNVIIKNCTYTELKRKQCIQGILELVYTRVSGVS